MTMVITIHEDNNTMNKNKCFFSDCMFNNKENMSNKKKDIFQIIEIKLWKRIVKKEDLSFFN